MIGLEDVIEFVSKEWRTLTQAPVISLMLIAITATITWKVLVWRYKGIIESLETRLKTEKHGREEEARIAAQRMELLKAQASSLKVDSVVSVKSFTAFDDSNSKDLRIY